MRYRDDLGLEVKRDLQLTFRADLAEVDPLVAEDLDAVCAVVWDEDLLAVVDNDAIGELEVLGAAKLVQHISQLVENDDPHHLGKSGENKTIL